MCPRMFSSSSPRFVTLPSSNFSSECRPISSVSSSLRPRMRERFAAARCTSDGEDMVVFDRGMNQIGIFGRLVVFSMSMRRFTSVSLLWEIVHGNSLYSSCAHIDAKLAGGENIDARLQFSQVSFPPIIRGTLFLVNSALQVLYLGLNSHTKCLKQ